MTDTPGESRSIVMERHFPYPPERVWRALTQPDLMEAWLMKNDFQPVAGRPFELKGDWGSVACKVIEVEPHRSLSYSWEANGLVSVVRWTLAATRGGTTLRLEQAGFRADQVPFYQGALAGWTRMLSALEEVVARAR